MKSDGLPTAQLYPNLEPQQPSAPNAYDNLLDSSWGSPPPDVKTVECNEKVIHKFRLHKISDILKILEIQHDKRASLVKKYHLGINVLTQLSYASEVAKVSLGTAGVALPSTVIATPLIIAMEGVALGTGRKSFAFN